eukprot:1915358-Lingulodinium_polyedra.AAC.1
MILSALVARLVSAIAEFEMRREVELPMLSFAFTTDFSYEQHTETAELPSSFPGRASPSLRGCAVCPITSAQLAG